MRELVRHCRIYSQDSNEAIAKEDRHACKRRNADRFPIIWNKIAFSLRRDRRMKLRFALRNDAADSVKGNLDDVSKKDLENALNDAEDAAKNGSADTKKKARELQDKIERELNSRK